MHTILVVDDNEAVRLSISQALQHLGHVVLEANDGPAAVAVLAKTGAEIDLVLFDLQMSAMDGIETIQALWTHSPNLPAIAISGAPTSPLHLQAERMLGYANVLVKPFSFKTLSVAVATVLERAQAPERGADDVVTLAKEGKSTIG